MGKKKSKKNQKGVSSNNAPQTSENKKKREENIEEDIERDDDLYISDSDAELIRNFIRTTNKSFHSLGNTVVETFLGRCALGISHALMSMYDETSTVKDDVIRRLNTIYIMYRLPEIETEIRLKPQKNMNDIYNHMFASFLFYAEKGNLKDESLLARLIVCNSVSIAEKLTAADFMKKTASFTNLQVDYDAYEKWEKENTSHWPEQLDNDIPVSILMRHADWDRKEFENGMQEAFYPLYHHAPTLVPSVLPIQEDEIDHCREKAQILKLQQHYRLHPNYPEEDEPEQKASLQEKLMEAFQKFLPDITKFQEEQYQKMSPSDVNESKQIIQPRKPVEKESSEDSENEVVKEEEKTRSCPTSNVQVIEFSDKTISHCIDQIIEGTPLPSTKVDLMVSFLGTCSLNNEQYKRLYQALKSDNLLSSLIKLNPKIASELMSRVLTYEGVETLKRYMNVLQTLEVAVQSMEVILKLTRTLSMNSDGITSEHREPIYTYIRHCLKTCEEMQNHRSIRLISLLLIRLLNEQTVLADDIFADVKPFVLKFSNNRDATSLYQIITEKRNRVEQPIDEDQPGPSTSASYQ